MGPDPWFFCYNFPAFIKAIAVDIRLTNIFA